jgi:hypothetical protein
MAALQVNRQRVVTADGARGRTMSAELLLFGLPLFVRILNLLERGCQRRRLDSDGGRLSPSATPGAHGATKSLVHALECYTAGLGASKAFRRALGQDMRARGEQGL